MRDLATTRALHEGDAAATPTTRHERRRHSRGQVLVIFTAAMFALLGMMAIVIDVSWYWANSLRVQRAADAAALAGAVLLPADIPGAKTRATSEATKNGYTAGGGVIVTSTQDANNTRQLDVTISAPVSTFFMRLVGINTITATRSSSALYVLPVPMGSPENYYGVFGMVRHPSGSPTAAPAAPTHRGLRLDRVGDSGERRRK